LSPEGFRIALLEGLIAKSWRTEYPHEYYDY
jgi:hypothetical protein